MSVTSRWRLVLARVVGAAVAVGSVLGVGLVSLPAASAGATAAPGSGFWLVGQDGGVFAFGSAAYLGGPNTVPPDVCMAPVATAPIDCAGIAATPDGHGYWLVGMDGGVFAYGDAAFYGSMGGRPLNAPVGGIAPTADGRGYWLVSWDGGVFAFGDATFAGSMGGRPLNALMMGIARNPDGPGYWTVGQDGGVFAFGGAPFLGSMADHVPAVQPVFAIAASG